MTLPAGMQHRIPRSSTAGLVPLYPARDRGDERMGLIRVPRAWAEAKQHTNEHAQRVSFIERQLGTWCEWLDKKGWTLNSTPKVVGPFDPPTETEHSDPQSRDYGMVHYHATAFFQRQYPLYVPFEVAAFNRDEALKYGDDHMLEGISDSGVTAPVRDILNPERVDPMVFAAERRARLGIKPDDWTQQPIT